MKSLKILKSNEGFTMVEMMVVGAILAVMVLSFTAYMYNVSKQTSQAKVRSDYNALKASVTTVTANVDTLNQSQYLTTSSPGI